MPVAPIRGSEDIPRDRVERLSRSISDAVENQRLFEINNPQPKVSVSDKRMFTRHPGSLLVWVKRTRYPVQNR